MPDNLEEWNAILGVGLRHWRHDWGTDELRVVLDRVSHLGRSRAQCSHTTRMPSKAERDLCDELRQARAQAEQTQVRHKLEHE